jgi:hypothetical protein
MHGEEGLRGTYHLADVENGSRCTQTATEAMFQVLKHGCDVQLVEDGHEYLCGQNNHKHVPRPYHPVLCTECVHLRWRAWRHTTFN